MMKTLEEYASKMGLWKPGGIQKGFSKTNTT